MVRSRACAQVYPDCNETTASSYGGRVAARPEVAARIAELQGESAGKATMVMGQRLCFLRDMALTPYGEVDEKSPLCCSVHKGPHGVYYRMPDKLWAVDLYSKLAGDFQADAVRPTYMDGVIARIWAGKGGRSTSSGPSGMGEEIVEKPGERALRNGGYERFAQLVAEGERYARSYTQVFGTTGRSAESGATAVGQRPEVRARIKYLLGQAAAWANWPMEHRLRYLQDFIRLSIGEVDEFSMYCQGVHLNKYGREVRVPSKMQAIDLYTKLEKVRPEDPEDGKAGFVEMMARIRRRREEADRLLKSEVGGRKSEVN
ncbi:hypothetical protein BH09VER1_BH09VER1_17590 [soil metagenome]